MTNFSENKKKILLVLTASLLFIVAFFPVFITLVDQWTHSEDYTHAIITLPIIGYMVWQKRQVMTQKPEKDAPVGLLVIFLSAVVYLVALHAQIRTLASLSMVMNILGVVVYIRGFQAVKELSTPFVLLLLLIPVPGSIYSSITLPLQLKVSQTSEIVVRIFSVPVYREGNILTIPEKTFQIVQACSGMRSIMTLVTLSLIIGYFTLTGTWSKLALVFTSIPVAVLINVIRVVVLILAFHFYRIDLSVGNSHTMLGMGIFIVALVVLFSFKRIIERWESRFRKNLS